MAIKPIQPITPKRTARAEKREKVLSSIDQIIHDIDDGLSSIEDPYHPKD